MIVLIAQLTGITDVAALIALFGVNASMILFGLLQEHDHEPGGSLLPFWLGCIAGIVPWVAITVYALSPGLTGTPPAFVIAIFISLFTSSTASRWCSGRSTSRSAATATT